MEPGPTELPLAENCRRLNRQSQLEPLRSARPESDLAKHALLHNRPQSEHRSGQWRARAALAPRTVGVCKLIDLLTIERLK
jgi:hypothetical protein